jgi:thiamine-phosphate pyrophosphorylase
MRSKHALAAQARRLNREAGSPSIPALYFFTDPERTPDPRAIARRLPRGAAVVYRHFGAQGRELVARQLASLCRSRGLRFLVAGDPALARRVGADGVHWPEDRLSSKRGGLSLVTAAAHSAAALERARLAGVDAVVLAPVFETRSASGRRALGPFRASQLARSAGVPVIALGGVNSENARLLAGRGFAGLAAVGALAKI